jgi:hypothetical protein
MGHYPHFILPMRSSRGFASAAANLFARFGLAFASAAPQRGLTMLTTVRRRIIMQKARHHPGSLRRALTACRRVVSGSLSSPCRGSSHLSLALLGSLSVAREYLALRDGPRGFRPASTCRVLLRCRTGSFPIRLRASHPLWRTIPGPSAWVARPCVRSYNPTRTSPGGLGWSAFARRY